MMQAPKRAMVMAAGLGTRMRPLTNDRCKALVELGGKSLIDWMLDRLAEAGVEEAVVNVHHFADRLESHLSQRAAPTLTISDERDELLETGGGLAKAAPLLGDDPIFVANIDSVWREDGTESELRKLARAFDPDRMDALLLITPTDAIMPMLHLRFSSSSRLMCMAPANSRKPSMPLSRVSSKSIWLSRLLASCSGSE